MSTHSTRIEALNMPLLPPFCGEDRVVADYHAARVVVLPVPYEGTVSYGHGTGEGPRAILEASSQLEMYDEELDRRIDEAGIFTLPAVDVSGGDPKAVMERIRAAALAPLRWPASGKPPAGPCGTASCW